MSNFSPVGIEDVELGELKCWHLSTPHATALIARQGAQVLSYQVFGQPPVVWLSDTAQYVQGQSLRGGIPVCWPWFGDLLRNPQAVQSMVEQGAANPMHGLVRTIDWQLQDARSTATSATLALKLEMPQGLGAWRHAAELELRVHLSHDLQVSLTTRNRGDAPMVTSQALHTYFAVGDSRQARIDGLEGCSYVDTLEDWQTRVQDGPLSLSGETDRIYTGIDQPLVIHDSVWRRAIHVRASGSRSAVLWNPWVEKSQRLSQFRADAWQDMLCIETARVWDDLQYLAPGESATMGLEIQAEPVAA